MNSVIEKITLYDFFGYFIPGLLYLSLLAIYFYINPVLPVWDFLQVYEVGMIGIILIWGFVCGIIISEISRLVSNIVLKIVRNKYIMAVETRVGLNLDTFRKALINAKVIDQGENVTRESFIKYINTIYGLVQIDEKFKRIHNYSSSESMYKNLSAAILLGLFPTILLAVREFEKDNLIGLVVIWILLGGILAKRSLRFKIKKDTYTLIWFVSKYSGN